MTPAVSRLVASLRPESGPRGLVACLVLWVPLVTTVLSLTFGGTRDFARRWLVGVSIADTVCFLCFGGALLFHHLSKVLAERRGGEAPATRSAAFYFGLASLLMPCVLPVGMLAGARMAGLLGHSYRFDIHEYRTGLGFGAVMMALFFLHRARAQARERVRDLERANLEARLSALTAEMNPHMLFNALNTVASLVHSDPDRAEATVLELAEVYRGILRSAGGATHPLADELRLCEAYLRVESARYGERLRVSFSVDDRVDARGVHVPVLLLQPLVENAVRHGIAPRPRGGTIDVRVVPEDGAVSVVVEDDGVGVGRSETAGNGRALANCRERLRLAFGEGAMLDVAARAAGGTRACVKLPVLVAA